MKTAIIALSAAALIAAAPAVYAQDASSKTPRVQHNVSKRHVSRKLHPGVSAHALRPEQTTGWMRSYPGAFGYAPGAPKDYTYENSRNGGGGGGGGGGM